MTIASARHYPRWLRAIVAVEVVAIVGTGGFLLFLTNLLSGPLTPMRWEQVSGLSLALPILTTAILVMGGRELISRNSRKAGMAITLSPLLLLGLFLLWASI